MAAADASAPQVPLPERTAAVIVDNVRVSFRTYGGRRPHQDTDATDLPWVTMLGRLGRHVGAVETVQAVQGVSFIAWHGESIGVVGRNGSGKTSLLRAVAGLLPLESGHVWARGKVSLLGVSAALVPQLTGIRNIMLGGLAHGLAPAEVRKLLPKIVEFSGIGDAVHLPMSSYSSGMGARLRFAIATAVVPDVLIIDEALSTGDREFRERSTRKVEEVREAAGTVFLVSHSASAIRKMCDRVLWMQDGQLLADGGLEVLDAYEAATRPPDTRRPRS